MIKTDNGKTHIEGDSRDILADMGIVYLTVCKVIYDSSKYEKEDVIARVNNICNSAAMWFMEGR